MAEGQGDKGVEYKGGARMTVGEIIALLVRYASNGDEYLMSTSVCDIEVNDGYITVYPINGSSYPLNIFIDKMEE